MENQFNNRAFQASVIGLAGVVLGAAKSVFARMAYQYNADPITVLYLRMLISFPFLLIIGLWFERKRPSHQQISRKDLLTVAGLSILGYYISAVLDFIGLVYVEASIERLIIFMYPTIVIVLSAVFMKKRVKTRQFAAISITYLGIILAFGDKVMIKNTNDFWIGAILIFLSAFTYAIFITISDNLIARIGSVRFTTIAILTMCICVIIHAFSLGKANISNLDRHVIWPCVLMALLSTIAPIYMFNYAMSRLGATNISIISCLGPVCTLLLSVLLLSERISGWQVAGTFVVMGGVFIISSEKLKLSPDKMWSKFYGLWEMVNFRNKKGHPSG